MKALSTFLILATVTLARAEAPSREQRDFLLRLAAAALARTEPPTPKVTYDPTYFALKYPGGDPPQERGVCTDVVIRSYRALGIDLQKDVHEDMAANFAVYPRLYGLKRTDANIDHRRVPNLRVFFTRRGTSLPPSKRKEDYLPGDLVTWNLPTGQGHIGVVADKKTFLGRTPLIVHNVGSGDVLEDVLFEWDITGHYRYLGAVSNAGGRH